MKALFRNTWIVASLLALAALLLVCAPAFAEGEPPPEAPAAPGAPPAPDAASDAAAPAAAPNQGAAVPLALTDLPLYTGGDPWWKVGSTTYQTMFSGHCDPLEFGITCWESATPIAEALSRIEGMGLIPSNRYLYIAEDLYPANDNIIIDGSTQQNLAQLKGIIGDTMGDGVPIVTMQGHIIIQNMPKGFYLQGLNVETNDIDTNVPVKFNQNSGLIKLEDMWIRHTLGNGEYGLQITSNLIQSVELNRVRVNDNPKRGAEIYSGNYSTSGFIKITNSSFNNNQGAGADDHSLKITSNQPITINGVSATLNIKDGVRIDRFGVTETKPSQITITNSSFSGSTTGSGLYINYSYGTVTLDNVQIIENDGSGIRIFNEGNVTVKNSMIIGNGTAMVINTCQESLSACTRRGAGHVSLSGLTVNNNSNMLSVYAKGNIFASQLAVRETAIVLGNEYGSGSVTAQYVSVINPPADGFYIMSAGSVALRDVDVLAGDGMGLAIDNSYGSGNVTISGGVGILNQYDGNLGDGLYILSHGNITLADVSASQNGDDGTTSPGYGAVLENDGLTKPKKVTINNGAFNHNYGNGLSIISLGAITIKGIQASENQDNGFNGGDGVLIVNPTSTAPVVMAKNGKVTNQIGPNDGDGLRIETEGQVTVSDLQVIASDYGVYIKRDTNIAKPVSLSNVSIQDSNLDGLRVENNGLIKLKNVNSINSDNWGASLLNKTHGNAYAVSVDGGDFSDSLGGLLIGSDGAVTLSNITVEGGGSSGGIIVQNHLATSARAVKLTNCLTEEVTSYGITIISNGAVSLMNCSASQSGVYGVYINNAQVGYKSPVTIKASSGQVASFNINSQGMEIQTYGAITLANVSVDQNTSTINPAALLDNDGAGTAQKVSISNSTFDGNRFTGLMVNTLGVVKLTTVSATGNEGAGAILDNDNSLGSATITKSNFSDNDQYGVQVRTQGKITLNTLVADYNGFGIHADNAPFGARNAIAVSKISSSNNGLTGVLLQSGGSVSVSYLTANMNSEYGLDIANDAGGQKVTLTNIQTGLNGYDGIRVIADNTVTLNLVTSSVNGGASGATYNGLTVMTGGFNVTIKNSNFTNNHSHGIEVVSLYPGNLYLINTNYLGNFLEDITSPYPEDVYWH